MSRSIFHLGAALLSVAALGAAGMLVASAANAAVTATIFDAPSISQGGVPDFTHSNYTEFDSKGQFTSGAETPENIPNLPNKQSQSLYSVAFDKYALSRSTAGLADDESLYPYSSALAPPDSALATGKNLPIISATDVSDFTTVPIPAAVWLLGAGLLGLIAVARPRGLVAKNLPQASHATVEKRPHGEGVKPRDHNRTSEYRWYAAYSSWPGELC
jgi:hypothetical protein